MSRREFSARTKVEAFALAQGCCQSCGIKLSSATGIQYDHIIPDAIGGEPTLENCSATCRNCHRAKTSSADMPRIAKAKRNYRHNAGIKRSRTILSWRKFSGEPVRASRQR